MLIERVIELQLKGPGPPGPNIYSYNWLLSWQNKNLYGKSSSGLLFTAKMLQETMHITIKTTHPSWTRSLTN